jgi:hypothetical protein
MVDAGRQQSVHNLLRQFRDPVTVAITKELNRIRREWNHGSEPV